MSLSAMPILAEPCPTSRTATHQPAELALRRRLLSHALASVVASKGQMHMPDEAVFEALTLPAMIASAYDASLERTQREDVVGYIAAIGADTSTGPNQKNGVQALHDETVLALKPSLICMRWPGKTS